MVKINSFQAIIPQLKFISKVPTQPYANYSANERELEIQNNPYSFLNIISNNKINDRADKFAIIRKRINDFKSRKILIKSKQESLYIYRQTNMNHTYTGLICAISLKDYKNNNIKVHEKTITNRELVFAEYLKKTKIYAEPVLIACNQNLTSIHSKYINDSDTKAHDFYTQDKIRHEIWEIKETNLIKDIVSFFKKIENLYIADGHHRLASSLRNDENAMCLAYIVSKNELETFPFHRKITNITKSQKVLTQIKRMCHVSEIKEIQNNSKTIQFYMNKKWYKIELKHNPKQELIENLLVSKLLKNILTPVFNIEDERTDKNVHFIAGNQDVNKIIKELNKNDCLFLMNTIDINTIIKIANQNKTTPPKSTFILPKLPSGLIMMELP